MKISIKEVIAFVKADFEAEKSAFEKAKDDVFKAIHNRRGQMLLDVLVALGNLYPDSVNHDGTRGHETDN